MYFVCKMWEWAPWFCLAMLGLSVSCMVTFSNLEKEIDEGWHTTAAADCSWIQFDPSSTKC